MAHIADDTPDQMVRAAVSKADVSYWRDSLTEFWRGCCARERRSMSDLRVKCAEMSFRAAERDLLTLRDKAAAALEELFGFYVRQAAEKAFEIWFLLPRKPARTRSPETLMGLRAAWGGALPPFRKLVPSYAPCAVAFRHEGGGSNAGPMDREEALVVEASFARVRRAPPAPGGE